MTPAHAALLKTLRGDDKHFGSESYGIELTQNESAVGRVWASSGTETIDKPADDKQFARQQLAKDFNITKICLKFFAGGVLEWGMGPTCESAGRWSQPFRSFRKSPRCTLCRSLRKP